MHLHIIRHADPDYETDDLTPQGHLEARALGKKLAACGIDYIYSSDAGRAVTTARYIAEATGRSVMEAPWLMEPSHIKVHQNGRDYVIWDTFGETVRRAEELPNQDTWTQYPPFDTPHISETWQDFQKRSDRLVESHGYSRVANRYRILSPQEDQIALVCHNGVVLMFLAYFLGLPLSLVWSGFYIWPSSVTTIFFETHSDEWAVPRVLAVADTSHIYSAGLEPQPRGLGPDRYEPYVIKRKPLE